MAVAAEKTREADSGLPSKPIPQTSIAERGTPTGEVTVRFNKWTAHGMTAYQRGQFAGFPLDVAMRLEAARAVTIDPGARRSPAIDTMVTK